MIMPRGSGHLLLPVNPWFIVFSLSLALAFALMPWGRVPAMPDVLGLVLVFWCVQQPRRVGVGLAFSLGLVIDVNHGAVLGQHALAYALQAYAAVTVHRRLNWFGLLEQMAHVLPIFALGQIVLWLSHWVDSSQAPGWTFALAPLGQTLLWPVAHVLLLAPQRRAPDPDEHRPL